MIVHFQDWQDKSKRNWNAPVGILLSVPKLDDECEIYSFLRSLKPRRVLAVACLGPLAQQVEDLVDDFLIQHKLDEITTTTHANETLEEACNFMNVHMGLTSEEYVLVFEGDIRDPLIQELRDDEHINFSE